MLLLPVCCILSTVLHIGMGVDLTYYIEEGRSPGTYIGDIPADMHLLESMSLENRRLITFSQLLSDGPKLFRVSKKTGKLYTAQMLDAEHLCSYNKECFKIIKIAVRQAHIFMKIVKIKVVLKDVNDHQPEFPVKQINIEFEENDGKGTRVSIPNSIDRDVGSLNSQITYQLKKNKDEPFTLAVSKTVHGMSELSIILGDSLDREVKDSYDIQVIAKDGGLPPKQSVLDVHISVTDVNDNTPIFTQNVYNVSISYEHDVSIPVAVLSARDLDSGSNGKISYHFSSKTSDRTRNRFRIEKATGKVFLQKPFTSQQKQVYELYVKASDGASPPASSIAQLLVNVISEQNNVPTIDVNFVSASMDNTAAISENVAVGSFIAYVMVTDPDFGPNGEVSCRLHHDKFQLQSLGKNEWKVTVKKPLDRETEDHHDVIIHCQDKGTPALHSESKFSINVMDVNDVQPQFSKETFKFWINENLKNKSPVGVINATDPDLGPGGKLTYFLLSDKKDFLPFQITNDGHIATIISLDHEFQNVYKFQVLVKDNGVPSLNRTVNVIVEVRDENDNAPYFTFPNVNPFTMAVVYYPHNTRNITVLRALDRDSRQNAFLKYEITAGNDKQLFILNHYTGLLSFSREMNQQDAGSYYLQFIVKDSGNPILSATTNLSLVLTVSNKSSETLTAVHVQSKETIHMYLLIVIVLVAVTLSVPITATISICFIRHRNKRQIPLRNRENTLCKCSNEPTHYMCSPPLVTYWPDVPPPPITGAPGIDRDALQPRSRRGIYPGDELDNKLNCSASGNMLQTSPEGIYQEIEGDDENEHKPFMIPECQSESEDTWSDIETRNSAVIPDLFASQKYKPHTSQPGTIPKSPRPSCPYPGESGTLSKILYKPNAGRIPDCSQWICLKPTPADNSSNNSSHSKPCKPPEARCSTFDPNQLPSGSQPQPYLDYLGGQVALPEIPTQSSHTNKYLTHMSDSHSNSAHRV